MKTKKTKTTKKTKRNLYKRFHIIESRPVIYTYELYARSRAEALRLFKSGSQEYVEIGSDPGNGVYKVDAYSIGVIKERCATCGDEFNPRRVRDYLCDDCANKS